MIPHDQYNEGNILYELTQLTNKGVLNWTLVNDSWYETSFESWNFIYQPNRNLITTRDITGLTTDLVVPKVGFAANILSCIENQRKFKAMPFLKTMYDRMSEKRTALDELEDAEFCDKEPGLSEYEVGMVQQFLKVFDFMFDADWATTKEQLNKVDTILTQDGTFAEPKVELEGYEWAPWAALVRHYKQLKCQVPELF